MFTPVIRITAYFIGLAALAAVALALAGLLNGTVIW